MRKYRNDHDARCIDQPCEGKVFALDRCQRHYNANYHKKNNRNFYDPNRGHDGLVQVSVKGWGALVPTLPPADIHGLLECQP